MPLDLECKNNLSFISRVFSWPGLEHQIYILHYCGAFCDNEFKQVHVLQKCIPLHCIKWGMQMPFVCHLSFDSDLWAPPPCIRSGSETHPSLPLKAYVFYQNAVLRILKTENLKSFLCNKTLLLFHLARLFLHPLFLLSCLTKLSKIPQVIKIPE